MYELVVVAISLLTIVLVVIPATSVALCVAPKKGVEKPPSPQQLVLPRYKPGHIPNFADGVVDLIEDDTLYEVKTEVAFPEKEAPMSSVKSKNEKCDSKIATPSPSRKSNKAS